MRANTEDNEDQRVFFSGERERERSRQAEHSRLRRLSEIKSLIERRQREIARSLTRDTNSCVLDTRECTIRRAKPAASRHASFSLSVAGPVKRRETRQIDSVFITTRN